MADYYPFGKILREWTTCEVERYLTTYHERDKETGYDYRGARYYDSELGRFLGVYPLAHEYPKWSTYTYVVNNPILFVDPDGRTVKPADETASNYIKDGLSVEESAYYRLDSEGVVDAAYLRQGLNELGGVGGNYMALLAIAEHPTMTEVIVSDNFTVINHDGKLETISFGEVSIESEADMMWAIEGAAYEAQGVSKEQYIEQSGYSTEPSIEGWTGVTLYGDTPSGQGYGRSVNGNTQVVINGTAPAFVGTRAHAHENYGHNFFHISGRPSGHREIKSLTSDAPNNNKPLEIQIYNREQEAQKNYNAHH